MASKTLYGIVQPLDGEGGIVFRLHLSAEVAQTRIALLSDQRDYRTDDSHLILQSFPILGLVHERELYLSTTRNEKGTPVLHLKEGPRFLELANDPETFQYWLVVFLKR